MAVIPRYESTSQVGNAVSYVDQVKLDNSGTMANVKAGGALGNAILAGANELHQTMVTTDIMQANNEYNSKMNELQAKLFENKEGNARDNMEKYTEGRTKILDEVMKKGPSSMRDPIVRAAFMQTANKDWVNQQNRMRTYVMGEEEKYQTTVRNNGLIDCTNNVISAYGNDQVMNDAVTKGEAFVRASFAKYGTEKQELEIKKWKGTAYGSAVNAAAAADDWTRAGGLLQTYGKFISPDDRFKMEKAISERRKADMQATMFQEYAQKWGHNVEGAIADYRARHSSGVDVQKGMDFWNGIMGTQRGSNQCANTVSDYINAAGGDQKLISPLADGMQYNAEQAHLAFTDKSQLRDGDIVFWATGNWEASEDPAAINNDKHDAYHGTDHVGVYNAKTGKVVQSGEHGVSELDLDYYKVTGFAHPGNRQKTASEMFKEEQALRSYMTGQINAQKQQEDRDFKDSMTAIASWKGTLSLDDAMKKAVGMAGADPEKIAKAESAVRAVYYDEVEARSKNKSLAPGVMYGIEQGLHVGAFQSKQQLSDYLLNPQVHASAEQYTTIMRKYDDAQQGKGEFKFNRANILQGVMSDSKLKGGEKQMAENAAWAAIQDYIQNERTQHHREPNDEWELIKVGKTGMTERYYGTQAGGRLGLFNKNYKLAPGRLSMAGIDTYKTYQIDGTNDYYVVFKDPRKQPQRMPIAELYDYAYNAGEK